MKKLNYINLIFFIAIFVICLLTSVAQPLMVLDEMWNYNISKNIAEGLVPYKDISMITTPLFSMLTAIFLKFVSNEIIVTRVLNSLMLTFTLYFIYKILQQLKVKEGFCHLFIAFLIFITRLFFTANYNILLLLLAVIVIYLELRNRENIDFKFDREFFIGLFIGLAICTKHTIGLILFLGMMVCNFIFVKKDFKLFIKKAGSKLVGVLLPVVLLIGYLFFTGALYDFYDYCFLGINSFSNYVPYFDLILNNDILFVKVLAFICPLMFIVVIANIIYRLIKKQECSDLFIVFVYSVVFAFGIYPIADVNHFLVFMHPCYILIGYYLFFVINKYLKAEKIINVLCIIISVFIIGFLIYNSIQIYSKKEKTYNINHYKYVPIKEAIYKDIVTIGEFASKNDTLILDSESAMYMIPLDQYHKDYDMLNRGNFGSKCEEGIIEDLKKRSEYVLILNDKKNLNWQTPKSVIEYVKNNMKKVGTISIYDIYKW